MANRECIICKQPVPPEETKLVYCGRCNTLISPGHPIHDECWEKYQERGESEKEIEPMADVYVCDTCAELPHDCICAQRDTGCSHCGLILAACQCGVEEDWMTLEEKP